VHQYLVHADDEIESCFVNWLLWQHSIRGWSCFI